MLKNGIPVAIGGTTSNPTFAPNLRGVAAGVGASAGQQLLNGKGNSKQNGNQSNPLGNALGGLLEPALAKGSSMSGKADFSVDEWDLLRSSPLMASMLVVAASPSGPVGTGAGIHRRGENYHAIGGGGTDTVAENAV